MAINYEPVGWDTTKYFNPTNMNHMDDGIKAACDKADANEAAIADVNSNLKYQKFTCFSEESGNHGWVCNIEASGYTPIMYSLIHGGSSSVICGAENFNNTTISGYASNGNLEIIVNVLYLKTKS